MEEVTVYSSSLWEIDAIMTWIDLRRNPCFFLAITVAEEFLLFDLAERDSRPSGDSLFVSFTCQLFCYTHMDLFSPFGQPNSMILKYKEIFLPVLRVYN